MPNYILVLALLPFAFWIVISDLKQRIIPNLAVVATAMIGLLWAGMAELTTAVVHLIAAGVVTVFFVTISHLSNRQNSGGGFGMGDAKLFGAGAMVSGPWQVPELILIPSCLAVLFLVLTKYQGRLPFGVFIAPSILMICLLPPLILGLH